MSRRRNYRANWAREVEEIRALGADYDMAPRDRPGRSMYDTARTR